MPRYRARYDVIRQLRVRMNLTQEEVCAAAGVAKGTYQSMENGTAYQNDRKFGLASLRPVAEALDVDICDIAKGLPQGDAAPFLLRELDRIKNDCKERNEYVHTIHVVIGLWRMDGSILSQAIEEGSGIRAAELMRKLERNLERIKGEIHGYREFDWEENPFFRRAQGYAALQNRNATDQDLAHAILQLGLTETCSHTLQWLVRRLGDDGYGRTLQLLRTHAPADAAITPHLPETTSD